MKNIKKYIPALFLLLCIVPVIPGMSIKILEKDKFQGKYKGERGRTSNKYSWESDMARATETGDLLWTPNPFVFKRGNSVRYIDYENGDDNNDGRTKRNPWKHHPWDTSADGQYKEKEQDTYILKEVLFTGELLSSESQEHPAIPSGLHRILRGGREKQNFMVQKRSQEAGKREQVIKIFPMHLTCGTAIWSLPPGLYG